MPNRYQEHKYIWLEPWCDDCEGWKQISEMGRLWCEDDVFEKCGECGQKPVLYKIVSDRTRRRMKNNGETK